MHPTRCDACLMPRLSIRRIRGFRLSGACLLPTTLTSQHNCSIFFAACMLLEAFHSAVGLHTKLFKQLDSLFRLSLAFAYCFHCNCGNLFLAICEPGITLHQRFALEINAVTAHSATAAVPSLSEQRFTTIPSQTLGGNWRCSDCIPYQTRQCSESTAALPLMPPPTHLADGAAGQHFDLSKVFLSCECGTVSLYLRP